MTHPQPARLVREARERAGLSQRQLARRAGTSQSVVARIELGNDPNWSTFARLLRAAGFDLDAALTPSPVGRSHMLADVSRILAMSPEDRLIELGHASRLLSQASRRHP